MGLPPQLHALLVPIHKKLECGKCQCGGFVDITRAWVPRVMVGARRGITAVRLIVVGKNPGHPLPEEAERYCKAISLALTDEDKAELLFDAMVSWGEHCHLESVPGRQGIYHRKLMAFLRDVLSADTSEKVLDQAYFTEIVKCSTPEDEQGKFDPVVAKECIRNWFTKELEILPNVPLLALGRETEKLLRNIARDVDSRTVYLSHPSWPWYNYEEAKKKLQNYFNLSSS
jgi:hypothetical protein